jgi:AhpD family alkylhydroperoxidase
MNIRYLQNLIGGNKMKKNNFLVILLIVACIISISTTQVMAQETDNTFTELSSFMEKFAKKCPDIATNFYNLHETIIIREGTLSIKQKELIALGIAVSMRCEYCIYAHTASAMENGATEEEILEAASVSVLMSGGPGYAYIKHVIDALEILSKMKENKNTEK